MSVCSCGRALKLCTVAPSLMHDELLLARFADGALKHEPLKRARLAYEAQGIMREKGYTAAVVMKDAELCAAIRQMLSGVTSKIENDSHPQEK